MSTEINNESDWGIDLQAVECAAFHALKALGVSQKSELSITFTDPASISVLHERYLGLDGPTDVMSFPMDEVRPGKGRESEGMLGDVVICPAVASLQAACSGHGAMEEILLLEIHGILHLLGFDHNSDKLQHDMFCLQRHILFTFYLCHGGVKEAAPNQN